jgi:hypothetical protein
MEYCNDGERLFPPCSRGQDSDDPSVWRCLNAEIDKVGLCWTVTVLGYAQSFRTPLSR